MNADNTSGLRDALDFVNRQPCRCMSIAQLGERDYCDRCQSVKNLRALLARTEAGADGYDDGSGRVRDWRESDTRPHDASGDAAMLDWLRENEFDLVTRREDIGEDEYAIWWFVVDYRKSTRNHLHTVSGHPLGSPREAIIAAMQAKEAK